MILGAPQNERVPFERPSAARPGFSPRSLSTGFVAEFETFNTVQPMMARMAPGIRMPLASEPSAGTVSPSGAASAPAAAGLPGRVTNSPRVMSPALVMALGLQPRIRGGVRAGLRPDSFVGGGRNPGL
jgi:hypothetical protein